MSIKDKIIIYTNQTCPYCKSLKDMFDKEKLSYIEKDTTKYQKEYRELTNLTNVPTVPLVVYKDNYFVGGRDYGTPQMLVDMLKDFKPSKFNDSKHTLERLKTINYYIFQAFNRLEQKLNQIENKLNTQEDEHKSTS